MLSTENSSYEILPPRLLRHTKEYGRLKPITNKKNINDHPQRP